MSARLGHACKDARLRAGLRQLDVAEMAGVRHTTISHFEQGAWWVRETDRIVHAYAKLLGVAPEELWRDAIDRRDEP